MNFKIEVNIWTKGGGGMEVSGGKRKLCSDRLHNFNIYSVSYITMMIK
jgi:hypothetical protein